MKNNNNNKEEVQPWKKEMERKPVRKSKRERPSRISRIEKRVIRSAKKIRKTSFKKPVSFGEVRRLVTGRPAEKSKSGKKYAGPGRPAGIYKWADPRTGKKVPATTYYRIIRGIRSQQKVKAETRAQMVEAQRQQMLAKRGISPEESQAYQKAIEMKEYQRLQGMPTQLPTRPQIMQQRGSIQARRPSMRQPMMQPGVPPGYRVVTDLMTGRKMLKPLPPRERWTY